MTYDPLQGVQAADDEAYASQLAYLQGPDAYYQHILATAQAAKDRIREQYDETSTTTARPTPG